MNVIDLVQSLEMGRKSCLLTLKNDPDRCQMYFREGQVMHATYGELSGNEAVFKVLRWTGGNFQIDFEAKPSINVDFGLAARVWLRIRMEGLAFSQE